MMDVQRLCHDSDYMRGWRIKSTEVASLQDYNESEKIIMENII